MTPGLLALALWACGTSTEPAPAPAPDPVDADVLGWISRVALDPASFGAVVDPERAAWAALHAHRYLEAHAGFTTPAHRARAAWHQARLHEDLSRLTGHAHRALYEAWEARGTLPDAAHPVASLAARCTGVGDPARWAPDGGVAAPLAELELAPDHPWSARAALHRGADAAPEALLDAAPLVVEPAEGFERRFHDPCVHATLAGVWTRRVAADLGEGREAAAWTHDLGGLLFAPWLTEGSLSDDLSARAPAALLGLSGPLPLRELQGADEVQPARDLAASLDAALAARSERLLEAVDPDGRALLDDLGLVEAYRQDALVVRARKALLDGRPHQAATLLRIARDPDMGPGPRNPPELFVLLAEALVRTGHEREALDALRPLHELQPELAPLVEVLGDLAVLRGLERSGDAREP